MAHGRGPLQLATRSSRRAIHHCTHGVQGSLPARHPSGGRRAHRRGGASSCVFVGFLFFLIVFSLHMSYDGVHNGKPKICRVPRSLPSVKNRALGKHTFCRVPHSAKYDTRQTSFCRVPGSRQNTGTRQTLICRVSDPRQTRALGKYC